jgi:hypothetical protein
VALLGLLLADLLELEVLEEPDLRGEVRELDLLGEVRGPEG